MKISNFDNKSHGNTKLPYGLCKKYGITLPANATPSQAWDALKKETGITIESAFQTLSTVDKEDPNGFDTSISSVEDVDECLNDIISKFIANHKEKKEKTIIFREEFNKYLTTVHSKKSSITRKWKRYKPAYSVEQISDECEAKHGFPIDLTSTRMKACHDDYAEVADALDSLFNVYKDVKISSFGSHNRIKNYTPKEEELAFYYELDKSITLLGFRCNRDKSRYGSDAPIKEAYSRLRILNAKKRLSFKEKKELAECEYKVKFKRHNVSSDDKVLSLVVHEFGHAVMDQYLPIKYHKRIMQVMNKAIKSGDINKYVSIYSAKDFKEFYAECFTAYHLGQPLPQYIIDMVELPKKVHEGKVGYKDLIYGCSTKEFTVGSKKKKRGQK